MNVAAGTPGGVDQGSFRDPDSRVFHADGEILRALSGDGAADWHAFRDSRLFEQAVADGRLVGTEEVDASRAPALPRGAAAAVLRHERIPFLSYAYEWPFGMLRAAALLHLELLEAAIAEDLMLKDATPYNVQFRGSQAVFIDVGSFERLREGEPWVGYRQFCMQLLYPLLLRAYKDVPFHPWLRGRLDGIAPQEMRNLMRFRDLRRKGVFGHVALHARMDRRYEGRDRREVREGMRGAGFRKELILANVRKLRKLVERLDWSPPQGVWVQYGERNTYTDADAERKAAFVRDVAAAQRRTLTWDIGCNDGRYSRIAAEHADHVVALDFDEGIVELLYRSLRDEGDRTILPLVMNVADPSPGLGWRGTERPPLPARGRPDLVLCLALIHHVAITANVPVPEFLGWLAELGGEVVIEFVDPKDEMAQRLLAAKRTGLHDDYQQESFERALAERFEVRRSERLESGTRVLYHAAPRA